jgi:pimeloyl-ACP methyl ester carboxylesterase
MSIELVHGRLTLALHPLREGPGRPLLHLHGLGLRSPDDVPFDLEPWPGPIYALDFSGHGDSSVPKGGGYTPELLIGDVDAAIEHLGQDAPDGAPSDGVTLVGYGLGAYVGFMATAARHDRVRGTILCDGPGLSGGGPAPGTPTVARIDANAPAPPDPFAMAELSKDIRPPDYAVDFARIILAHSPLSQPVSVVARARPEWLAAVIEELGIVPVGLADALKTYS